MPKLKQLEPHLGCVYENKLYVYLLKDYRGRFWDDIRFNMNNRTVPLYLLENHSKRMIENYEET